MDRSRRAFFVTLIVLAFFASTSAVAQTEYTGQTATGAYYRILVPPGWTPAGGLVIWNHGFSLGPLDMSPDLGPLVDVQLSEGYAVAASSYSLRGWALFQTAQDLQELYEAFTDEVGVPEQVFVTGASLGGIVTAQAIEVGGVGDVVGAYPICGAVGGSRIWNSAFDLRLIYDDVCGDVPGAAIPGGGRGLPFPIPPEINEVTLAVAVNACTGVLLPPAARSAEQQERLDRILAVTSLPESFLLTDMGFATFGLADLIYDPAKLAGGQGLGNRDVDYADAELNASIERVDADPEARRYLLDDYSPTGDVGDVKIVSIHTDKDGLVLVENEAEYASVVPKKNLTVGVVVEDEPTHCGFTPGEALAGWEALRGWTAGLEQPTAAALQATCETLVAGGLVEGPCRYDPGYVVGDLDERVWPRSACVADATTLCLGEGGRFAARVSWEDSRGGSGVGQATAQGTQDTGLFWFFGPNNLELMVKVLDGRKINGNFWVFYGSLTDVSFELTVTDGDTGVEKTYTSSQGSFASLGDTEAF